MVQPITMSAAIHSHVAKAMEHLASEISSEDDRLACKVVPVGSAHEGTKTGCCDEFDYNFVLTELSRKCKVGYSPESPPGFVLLKASTPDYDEDMFNDNGTLNARIVKFKFDALVVQVLSSSQFCEETGFEFINQNDVLFSRKVSTKLHTCVKLVLIPPVNGCHVTHHISVDIVPALQINDWWPEDARRQDLCQTGECLIVLTQPQDKYPWIGWTEPHGFISFARAERRLLHECPQVVKAAYMVVKWIYRYDPPGDRDYFDYSSCSYLLFTSHVIKTALLWCLDDDGFSSCLQSSDSEFSSDNSDTVNWDEVLRLVQKILRRLLCFTAQDYVPCFFMPKCHQPVLSKEKYLKQFHMRLHQHGLIYTDLVSLTLNEKQLEKYDPLYNFQRLIVLSHVMYWTVLSDNDELDVFVPSTINPLREIKYQHLSTSFRRQLKTKVYNISDN